MTKMSSAKKVANKVTSTKAKKSKTASIQSRGRHAEPVTGQKILASGKVGKAQKFASVREAAMKVAPNTSLATAISNISHVLRGDWSTAYGYKWSR